MKIITSLTMGGKTVSKEVKIRNKWHLEIQQKNRCNRFIDRSKQIPRKLKYRNRDTDIYGR